MRRDSLKGGEVFGSLTVLRLHHSSKSTEMVEQVRESCSASASAGKKYKLEHPI